MVNNASLCSLFNNCAQVTFKIQDLYRACFYLLPLFVSVGAECRKQNNPHGWLPSYRPENVLASRIPPPGGFKRLPLPPDDFGSWLRGLPLKEGKPAVRLYDGTIKPNQSVHYAVLDIDTGNRDLQQCADAVIRLRAEYLFETGKGDDIRFNFTNGFTCSYKKWKQGYRPKVDDNNSVEWVQAATADDSYRSFRKYLESIFIYSGSYSLSKEMKQGELSEINPGDVLIQGGFPGHAVIVVDVCRSISSGKRLFMLAQSYMPAQDIHLLINPANGTPWFETTDMIETPEWTFKRGDLMTF